MGYPHRAGAAVLLVMLLAQLGAATASSATGTTEQDRVNATEIFDYARWRRCLLKETHRNSRVIADHQKIADLALSLCGTEEANYRSSLAELAQLYKVENPADFVRRNGDQARAILRGMMVKELQ